MVAPLKDEKGITITNAFQKNFDQSDHEQNKIWVDKVSEFYNESMEIWLESINIAIYLTHHE